MVPKNWSPLFFEWASAPELNVFELRLTVDNQINPLVVYTSSLSYTIGASLWKDLTAHSAGYGISIALRGARLEGGALTVGPTDSVTATIIIAPVPAPGSIVYGKTLGGVSLEGFAIGETSTKSALTSALAVPTAEGGSPSCISCHALSPDGDLIFYTYDADDGTRAIDIRQVGGGLPSPEAVSPSARSLLGRHQQTMPALSPAHYSPTDAVVISVFSHPELNDGRDQLIWTDLHATDAGGWGVLERSGDARAVLSPSWRHDGTEIAYVSSADVVGGEIASDKFGDETMDIYVVPYNDQKGGDAKPLAGASDPELREFYPVYSADDTLIAFNRADEGVHSRDEPSAELFVVPSVGGSPVRLQANDPPACAGLTSPGLTNSWPRWAPESIKSGERTYHWLVFSSRRRLSSSADGALLPQIYVAAVVTKLENGTPVVTVDYPAVYVTAQSPTENNVTPTWGNWQ
jgi:hypothetical protein